jgi:hypothetical protein
MQVMTTAIEKFRIVLIKPSKYDDDGYVIRFWKGVLPSNTLNVLHGLTEDVRERRVLGDLPIEVTTFDETAEWVPVKQIIRWSKEPGTKLLVCLVGVQTNQFPRALDMARRFKAENIAVIVGGFHTSGTINMLGEQEPDIQELFREDICVVSGEVEGKWAGILEDFLQGRHRRRAAAPRQLQDHGAFRLSELRHRRHLARLSVFLQLLHDHQRARAQDARAQSGEYRRHDAAQLSQPWPVVLLFHRR